jgi:HlyD family secretion protein
VFIRGKKWIGIASIRVHSRLNTLPSNRKLVVAVGLIIEMVLVMNAAIEGKPAQDGSGCGRGAPTPRFAKGRERRGGNASIPEAAARSPFRRAQGPEHIRQAQSLRSVAGAIGPYLLVTLLLTLTMGVTACHRNDAGQKGELVLSGNIEVVDAQVSFKTPGRMTQRLVSEGDLVKAGQLIAQLDDTEQKEELAARRAELTAAEAAVAELEAGSRPQEIASAVASVHSAEADRDRARIDFGRQKELLQNAVISPRDFETSEAQLKVAEARVTDASERLKLVREGPRAETIAQARARVGQAKAALDLAATHLADTRLESPLGGPVLSHNVEAGEFVSAGTPVITVADLEHVWVRTYIAQTDLSRIKHGQHVPVRTDALPGKTYDGVIGFISSEAEFTPKSVQTTKERVKLVFRVKVDLANQNDELKPGMPADVIIPAPENAGAAAPAPNVQHSTSNIQH